MSMIPRSIIVNGKRWAIDLEPAHGQCLDKYKIIQVDGRERKKRIFLESLIHEVIHAFLPDLPEETVDRIAKAIAALLWRIGYRL